MHTARTARAALLLAVLAGAPSPAAAGGDRRAGRWVRMVERIEVRRAAP